MLVGSSFISNVILNPTLELYMNSNFVEAKHTFVHHLKIWGENICPNFNKGPAMWQLEKRTQKFCSNQTMVGCDELSLNSIQVAAKITFVVCLHIYETIALCVC